MRTWSGTTRRLILGFGALVVIFGLSSWFTVAGLSRMSRSMRRAMDDEESVRLALELSSAVRDQYAHQAHTIIIGDRSHLPLYRDAQRRVLELIAALRLRARGADELAWMEGIERSSHQLDRLFEQRIVPAVLAGDHPYVQGEHARAQVIVSDIQNASAMLADQFEARIGSERMAAEAIQHRTIAVILGLLLGVPLIALGIALYVSRSIAVPLARLSLGAQRIEQGDLDTRIEVTSTDEFGALAARFNTMALAVKRHQEQLVQSEKLAGVGRLAAGVAHEINNPLGVILGYVRLLRKRVDRSADEDLAVVEEETLRCKEIVDGLLDLSRPVHPGHEAVDLRTTVEQVIERVREAGLVTDVDLRVNGRAIAPGHASRLRQVLWNLVRNAVEAAGPRGHVEVQVSEDAGEARVEVRDSGPGLSERTLDRLFEPFFTTKERGTGLGLAVSRAIARSHGGDVVAGNSASGGARFVLSLPARQEGTHV